MAHFKEHLFDSGLHSHYLLVYDVFLLFTRAGVLGPPFEEKRGQEWLCTYLLP